MKVISSGKTDKFTYAFKLSDERLKLFIDIAPLPVVPTQIPTQAPDPSSASQTQEVKTEVPVTKESKPKGKAVEAEVEPIPVSKQDIIAILPKELWENCIHHEVIDNIAKELSQGSKVEERRIAKGIPHEDGVNGRFILTVKKMSPKPEIHEDARGFIDFKDLHRFENIREGTIVAKIFPPTAGKQGTDPLGRSLPAKAGQPVKISYDATIIAKNHSEGGGQDLISAIEGFLAEENGKLSIQQELRVSGAIDYKVGSIDFIGSVFIQGDVLPGFIVRGKKGVIIKGAVQEATISSSEGAVEVFGPCMGSISSKVEAKTNVSITVANQMDVQAGISIQIQKEARDCELRSGGTINGTKAAVIGGQMLCACGVEAREIGARGGANTTVRLSSDVATTLEYVQNDQLIANHEKIFLLLKAHLGPYAKSEKGLEELSAKHRERLMPMILKKRAVEGSLAELKLKRQELLLKARTNDVFRVNFLQKIHAGVVVSVGEDSYSFRDDMSGPKSLTYDFEKKSFELGDLCALECSIVEHIKENPNDRKR